jgi:hypothetical protein
MDPQHWFVLLFCCLLADILPKLNLIFTVAFLLNYAMLDAFNNNKKSLSRLLHRGLPNCTYIDKSTLLPGE